MDTVGENCKVAGLGGVGVPRKARMFFCSFCSRGLGKKGIVPHGVVGHHAFFVLLLICEKAKHSCWATYR